LKEILKNHIDEIPINTSDIPQSLLNIENKDRSNLFPWKGQFSPQFVEALLNKYAFEDSVILDPFAGSGTVLYEAGRKKLSAIAAEINPAAYRMARVYLFINQRPKAREISIAWLDEALNKYFPEYRPLFSKLTEVETEEQIKRSLKDLAADIKNPLTKDLLEALIIRLDLYQSGLDRKRVISVWNKIKSLVLNLPYSDKTLEVINCDARAVPINIETVDLVITSPPYINVFNYHQQYRASAEALGWDLLAVAKSEIGSNRKHRGNRFLTVIQYCLDIALSLQHLARLCKKSARIIFTVGRESRVRGIPFFNGKIVGQLGTQCVGYKLETRQERVFINRYGERIYEDILHFTKPCQTNSDSLPAAREAARGILEEALGGAYSDVAVDLEAALCQLSKVEPSPIYDPKVARNGNHNTNGRNKNQ
jgi:hypothetical protein